MPLTNPPFARDPKKPPMYLRDLEPEEMEQWTRMRDKAEAHLKKNCSSSSSCDNVPAPSEKA